MRILHPHFPMCSRICSAISWVAVVVVPLVLVGFDPVMVTFCGVLNASYQFLLQGHARAAHFGKAGCVANRPARTARGQRPHHIHGSGCRQRARRAVGRFF